MGFIWFGLVCAENPVTIGRDKRTSRNLISGIRTGQSEGHKSLLGISKCSDRGPFHLSIWNDERYCVLAIFHEMPKKFKRCSVTAPKLRSTLTKTGKENERAW